jgi:hypothetical protein
VIRAVYRFRDYTIGPDRNPDAEPTFTMRCTTCGEQAATSEDGEDGRVGNAAPRSQPQTPRLPGDHHAPVPVRTRSVAVIADGYRCTVTAWPDDLTQKIHLGGYRANTPRLAVRWLRGQAARLADALDPQPGRGWAQGQAAKALRRLPDRLPDDWPDPGYVLREWQHDHQGHEQIMTALLDGRPFALTTQDTRAYYTLSARPWPVSLLPAVRWPEVASDAA